MGIEPEFNMPIIDSILTRFLQEVQNKSVRILNYVGEECVIEMRRNGAYNDQSGNLRGSAGYITVVNGMIQSQFIQPGEGGQKASALAHELAQQHPTGAALIVVSGMNYAAYVESRGLNVATSAEQLAEREIPKLLRQLRNADHI